MRILKHALAATIFVLLAAFLAGASEGTNTSQKEPEKSHAVGVNPSETTTVKNKSRVKHGNGKVTAESARDVAPIDTDKGPKYLSANPQDPTPKKKTLSRKKKKHHVAKAHPIESAHGASAVGAEEALKLLVDGNRRYIAGKNSANHRTAKRRTEVSRGQHPFAIIVGCSDSRVPPEILFDQGIGDLFVVRSAGNVIDDIAIGSIEYAVEHLGVHLIMVLGHERCGAVDATLKGGAVGGKLKSVVDAIKPAVEKAKAKGQASHGCDLLCSSVKSNARMVAEKIKKSSPVLTDAIENGVLRVTGAYYELESGAVSLTYIPVL